MTELSDAGLAFIADWEGTRLTLYNDDWKPSAVSQGNATIGVGHLVHLGPIDGRAEELPFVNGITEEEAMALFRVDAQERVDFVLAQTPNINGNQLAAMVDFAYNCGLGAYQRALVPVINSGGDVCAALLPFTKPDWAHDALLRRRQAECELWNTPEDEMNDEVKAAFAAILAQQGELGKKVDGLQHLMALSLPLIAAGKTQELADLLKSLGG